MYILVDYVCNRDLVNGWENACYFLFFAPVAEDDGVSGILYDAGPTAVCWLSHVSHGAAGAARSVTQHPACDHRHVSLHRETGITQNVIITWCEHATRNSNYSECEQ